jgi:cytochrome c biogenesis protein CcmG/thiol:disulfide interchange protein DsbE
MSATRPAGRLVAIVAGLALIGGLLAAFGLTIGSDAAVGSTQLDRPAPAFSLERLDGGRVSLDELRGRPVVLNFWASWCAPCKDEAPMLTKLAADHAGELVVVGVVYQDDATAAGDFMERYGQTYPGVVDPGGRTALDYGVFGIPETFYIDATGTIRGRTFGPLVADQLEAAVARILP